MKKYRTESSDSNSAYPPKAPLWRLVAGVGVLFLFLWGVKRLLGPFPVPPAIVLLIAFVGLLAFSTSIRRFLEPAADFLLRYMPLFFVPPLVGVADKWTEVKDLWLPIVFAVFVSSMIGLLVSGLLFRLLKNKGGHDKLKSAGQ